MNDVHPSIVPAVAVLREAGVVLVAVAPDEVVPARFARNLGRVVTAIQDAGSVLVAGHGSEPLTVRCTPDLLLELGRSTWLIELSTVTLDLTQDYGEVFERSWS